MIEALYVEKDGIRQDATQPLSEQESEKFEILVLVEGLKNESSDIRKMASNALIKKGIYVIPVLNQILRKQEKVIQRRILAVLSEIEKNM